MTDRTVHLGYEVGTGAPVAIPIRHMAVTGQTQEAGKTTTLEALIGRGAADGLRAVAFVTKRGERSFQSGTRIRPYFRERADWQFVSAVFEATLREKMRFERGWIMRACKGAKTLADVRENVRRLLGRAKGLSEDVYFRLDEYLELVVPQIEKLPYGDTVSLAPGLNIMDLSAYSSELQALVIRSVLEWVYEREDGVVVVIPEAWEFIPQRRGSPVKLAAEELIRKGAGLGNYLWLDSQDLAGVDAAIRKSVIVWLLGVQREENEVKRVLAHIPNAPKPKVDDVMQLGKGQFYACWADQVKRVYVQPAWMPGEVAEQAARIGISGGMFKPPNSDLSYASLAEAVQQLERLQEDEMSAAERVQYEERIRTVEGERDRALARAEQRDVELDRAATDRDHDAKTIEDLRRQLTAATTFKAALQAFLGGPTTATEVAMNMRALAEEVALLLPPRVVGQIVQVTPPEALRAEFQQQEVERILAAVHEASDVGKSALRLLLGVYPERIGLQRLAERLGRSWGGNARVSFIKAVTALEGFVDIQDRQGVRANVREKIAADLETYKPAPEEVEATYQAIVHALATSAVPAG